MSSYYDVLDVARDASSTDIKTAYRKLALLNHPDKSKQEDAKRQFQLVCEAYETLGDEQRRRAYDLDLGASSAEGRAAAVSQTVRLEEDLEWREETAAYSYSCRCGYEYAIAMEALESGDSVFSCALCSLSIRVTWDDEDEDEEAVVQEEGGKEEGKECLRI